MGENPSSPEDGLEDALRRALSDAVSGIEPSPDALNGIRARIDRRPPRPWLIAMLSGAVDRVRFWTWRGHWTWPGLALGRAHLPWRHRRARHCKGSPAREPPRRGDAFSQQRALYRRRVGLLWPAVALVSVTVIAGVSIGVQPLRQAIIQASATVLNGGPALQTDGAGTNGSRARATTYGSGVAAGSSSGTTQPGQTGSSGPANGPVGVPPGPASPGACQLPASGSPAKPHPTTTAPGATPTDSGTTSSAAPPVPGPADSGTGTATPDTGASGTCAATPETGRASGTGGTGTSATATVTPDVPGATATPDPTASAAWTCSVSTDPGTTAPPAAPEATGPTATPTDPPAPATAPATAPTVTATGTDPASTAPAKEAAKHRTSLTPSGRDGSAATRVRVRAGSSCGDARLRFSGGERHRARR